MVRKGGPDDPVARSIRNEQNQDAMPTQEELDSEVRREDLVHAQWKAIEVLIDRINAPKNEEITAILASILGFDALERRVSKRQAFRGSHGSPGFKTVHKESWEKQDASELSEEGARRQYPPYDTSHDMERIRRLKANAFLKLQTVNPADFRTTTRRLAPFGNSVAVAVQYKNTVYTNEVWDKVFDDSEWHDSFDEETREEYRDDLRERLADMESP